MFHRHVEALLKHRAFHVDVGARSDGVLSRTCCFMIETVLAFSFESAFAGLEDDTAFHALVAGLTKCLRALLLRKIFNGVVAWPGLVNLEIVLEEDLVDVKSRRGRFKSHALASHQLEVFGALLISPRLLIVQVGDFVFNTEHDLVVNVHVVFVFVVLVAHDHSCCSLAILLSEDAHVRSVARVV